MATQDGLEAEGDIERLGWKYVWNVYCRRKVSFMLPKIACQIRCPTGHALNVSTISDRSDPAKYWTECEWEVEGHSVFVQRRPYDPKDCELPTS
jgi:hypothetical protein